MPYQVVQIQEDNCIGCTKCVAACPVDAIVGASQTNHAVLTEYCIGCALCLPPCPVQCIDIISIPTPIDSKARAQLAKDRIKKRNERLKKNQALKAQQDHARALQAQDEIAQAIARSQSKKKFIWGHEHQEQA